MIGQFEIQEPRGMENMSKVIAVCGMPASGKGEFAGVLKDAGIPVLSMGDMIRAEVARRGIEEAPEVFGQVAAELRAQHGDDVLARRLCTTIDELLDDHAVVLIEGMRGTAERELFAQHWGEKFSTVAVVADAELRFERMQMRGRSEDGDREQFEIRDKREIGWVLDILVDQADVKIKNDVPLEKFLESCREYLGDLQ